MNTITTLLNTYAINKPIDVFVKNGVISLSDSKGAISQKMEIKFFEFFHDYGDSFFLVTLQDEKKLKIFL